MLVALLASPLLAAAPAPAAAQGASPALYCPGGLDAGVTQALTAIEQRRLVGDDPLPDGVGERRLRVGGVATRVLEAGPRAADEAIVFVHGNPGSARDWDALLARAGQLTRAVAFDVPGFGQADDGPSIDATIAGVARYVDGLLDELEIRRVHLVMHDLGGLWGLEWARSNVVRLRSATLLSTGVLPGYGGHLQGLSWSTPLAGELDMALLTRERFRLLLGAVNPLPARFVDRMYDDLDAPTRCALLRYYRDPRGVDELAAGQIAALRPADRPALVIWGQRDPFVPVGFAARQRDAFPRARVVLLGDAGHWPLAERSARTVTLAGDFLADEVVAPRLVARVRRPRAGSRRLSVRVRVAGAPTAAGVRLELVRGGRVVGSTRGARSVDRVARRIALTLRRPLRAGRRYALRLLAAAIEPQTLMIRVPRR